MEIDISFSPIAPGLISENAVIYSNDPINSEVHLQLSGLGTYTSPKIFVSDDNENNLFQEIDSINIKSIIGGFESTKRFKIYNLGLSDLTIEDIFVPQPFNIDPTFATIGGVSDQGEINSVTVNISVISSESVLENLSIYSDDIDNSETIIPLSYSIGGELFFIRDNTSIMATDGGSSSGTAFADINNDGNLDLVVANRYNSNDDDDNTPSRVYISHNDSYSQFDLSGTIDSPNDGENIFIADLHNDGGLSIGLTNLLNGFAQANFVLYKMTPDYHEGILDGDYAQDLEIYTLTPFFNQSASGISALSGDFCDINKDGYLDISISGGGGTAIQTHSGNIVNRYILFDDSQIQFYEGENYIHQSWFDIDEDGDKDLLQFGNGGVLTILLSNGTDMYDETLIEFSSAAGADYGLPDGVRNYTGASWGDFDNDGDMDLFISNMDGSELYRYENSYFYFVKQFPGAFGSSWGDLNNDGLIDLVTTLGQVDNARTNYLHLNLGNNEFESFVLSVNEDSRGVSLGDIDNDGDLDIYYANRTNQNNTLLYNQGNNNHWINILCIDNEGNRSGIGSKVKLKANIDGQPVWQMQEILSQTGGGFGGQNSLNVEFGLGNATVIDSILFEWSLGGMDTLVNVPVDTFIIFESGSSILGSEDEIVISEFSLDQNYPNPFNPITTINYNLPKAVKVVINIHDLLGRKVKTLVNKIHTSGNYTVKWDATNNLGQPVSAGMYIYTIQAGEFRETRKMVLLK